MPNAIQPSASIRGAVVMDGTLYILRDPCGFRAFLDLCRGGGGRWDWNYNWLDNDRNAENPALAFATLFISLPLS